MIIDAHGHYTTAPKRYTDLHQLLVKTAAGGGNVDDVQPPRISDEELRESLEGKQIRMQRERGIDLTLFSPRAAGMAHHLGDERTNQRWASLSNDLIYRVCELYPEKFVGVGQLPQSPGAGVAASVQELRRCVEELGFVGCNVNPDPSGGYWTGPPITDRSWYPLWETMCELDVPGMIHASTSCNPNFHTTGAHYLTADTAVFVQLMTSKLFEDFPTLRLVIPHGGGAIPFHWGRFRGLFLNRGLGELSETLLKNVVFDTCVYHAPGMRLLTETIPIRNLLFATEMIGAVRGTDPATGRLFDDTGHYLDQVESLSDADRRAIYEENAQRIYPKLNNILTARASQSIHESAASR